MAGNHSTTVQREQRVQSYCLELQSAISNVGEFDLTFDDPKRMLILSLSIRLDFFGRILKLPKHSLQIHYLSLGRHNCNALVHLRILHQLLLLSTVVARICDYIHLLVIKESPNSVISRVLAAVVNRVLSSPDPHLLECSPPIQCVLITILSPMHI